MSTLGKIWKIILSYKWGILIQFVIFIGLALGLTILMGNVDEGIEEFENVADLQVAIFDRDQTELTQNFVLFMTDLHDIVELEDSEEEWLDAARWGDAHLILEIPIGFTDSFVNGNHDTQLEYLTNPESMNGFLVRGQAERYFNILSTYLMSGFDIAEAGRLTAETLATGAEIEVVVVDNELFAEAYLYFRFLPISLVVIVGLALGGVFLALNKQDVTRRIESAPISYKRRVLERIIACLTFGVLAWGIFVAVAFVLFGGTMLETENLIRIVNSLPLVFMGIAFAFIITQFIEKREMLFTVIFSAVMTLATPAGIFIDLSVMGEQILAVARFTPFYWYSRVNDMMILETTIDWTLVMQSFVIQIAFAAAIIAVGMVFSKEKRAKRG